MGGGVGTGVFEGVGEGFLDDAVEGELAALGEGGLPLDGRADGEAGPAYAVEEAVEVREGGLRGQFGLRAGAVLVVVAQDVQEAAEFAERLAAGGADGVEGLGGAVRGLGGGVAAAVGEAGDDGEVVADDVVHLPGYARAFGGGGEPDLLVAFRLQAAGAVLQGFGVAAPGAHGDADEGGHADGDELRAELLVPGARAVPVAGDRDTGRRGHHGHRPPEVAQRQAQGDVVDEEELQQGGLEGGARPCAHQRRGQREEEGTPGVAAAPDDGDGEGEAEHEDEADGDAGVVGDAAPAVAGPVDEGGQDPEAGEGEVPQERMAVVEGADPPVDALDVLGDGFGGSVFRHRLHGLHPTMVGGPGGTGVRPGAVYEMRGVVPGYYGGRHECLGPR